MSRTEKFVGCCPLTVVSVCLYVFTPRFVVFFALSVDVDALSVIVLGGDVVSEGREVFCRVLPDHLALDLGGILFF